MTTLAIRQQLDKPGRVKHLVILLLLMVFAGRCSLALAQLPDISDHEPQHTEQAHHGCNTLVDADPPEDTGHCWDKQCPDHLAVPQNSSVKVGFEQLVDLGMPLYSDAILPFVRAGPCDTVYPASTNISPAVPLYYRLCVLRL